MFALLQGLTLTFRLAMSFFFQVHGCGWVAVVVIVVLVVLLVLVLMLVSVLLMVLVAPLMVVLLTLK